MKSEIVEKLKSYTGDNPEKEADVVYLMVQIGKIIESQDAETEFPTLWFYRNWVVHYQLDKKGRDGRKEMFDKLNDAVLSMNANNSDVGLQQFIAAISLRNLHKEVAGFFRTNELEKRKFDYRGWFKKFDDLLVRVLIDLPLLPPEGAGYAFTEFRFNRPVGETHVAEFEIKLPSGKSYGGPVVVIERA